MACAHHSSAQPESTAAVAPSDHVAELIAGLLQPSAYPFPVAQVDFCQTHISLLFFAGDRAYKLKKPIDAGFLNYTTLQRRRHFCQEEVRLNRRLAPQVYLGVVPVTRSDDGTIRIGGQGKIIDYAVEMVRLPEDRMMSRMLERSAITPEDLDRVVDVLVEFHNSAATGPGVDLYATPAELRRQVAENFRELEQFAGEVESAEQTGPSTAALSRELHQHLYHAALRFLDEHRSLLERRVYEGRVREGHGDLHAGNICLTDAGVIIYDCVEFTPRFRCRDVACELAFLAMDLDNRDRRDLANYLVDRYARLAMDQELKALMNFYKLHLACIRAKVMAMKAADAGVDAAQQAQAKREAMGYAHLAAGYALGPALILMCGLPGTGKSWAAGRLAAALGAQVLRSDVVRKQLAGIEPTQRPSPQDAATIYGPAFTEQTYAQLLARAGEIVADRQIVIVDATMPTAFMREPFIELARSTSAPLALVFATASDAIVRERMAARANDGAEVSDADWSVYVDAKGRFESPEEVPTEQRVTFDPAMPQEVLLARTIDVLIKQCEPRIRTVT